jgi:hypothetical protein
MERLILIYVIPTSRLDVTPALNYNFQVIFVSKDQL